jgi:hypothetical protein
LGWAAICFAIQLLFCFKARKLAIKLIPVYFLSLGIAFCLLMALGAFGTGSGVIGNVHTLAALILSIPLVLAGIGDAAAWIVYKRFWGNRA